MHVRPPASPLLISSVGPVRPLGVVSEYTPLSAYSKISREMSIACTCSLTSGRAERMTHAIEYTSAPLLHPTTEMATLAP